MLQEEEKLSLANLALGACIERFDEELQHVLDNLVDPNCTDGVRSITLTVAIKPNEARTMAKVGVLCKSSLAPVKAFETQLYVGSMPGGKGVAVEYNPAQLKLPGTEPGPRGVVRDKVVHGGNEK